MEILVREKIESKYKFYSRTIPAIASGTAVFLRTSGRKLVL